MARYVRTELNTQPAIDRSGTSIRIGDAVRVQPSRPANSRAWVGTVFLVNTEQEADGEKRILVRPRGHGLTREVVQVRTCICEVVAQSNATAKAS